MSEQMKRLIAFILMPVAGILLFFKKWLELVTPLAEDIGNGVTNIISDNYNFWEKVFKWKR